MDASDEAPTESTRKRLRTTHACDVCRNRKIRCNGGNPCSTCAASDATCTYGSEAISRGKSDLILERIARIEDNLVQLNNNIQQQQQQQYTSPASQLHGPAFNPSPQSDNTLYRSNPQLSIDARNHGENSFDNAVLDTMHTSTTESILQWPHLRSFSSLHASYIPTFQLEKSRPPLSIKKTVSYPYVATGDVSAILDAFGRNVNFWYPTMSQRQLHQIRCSFELGVPDDDSVSACLGLLTMALGCASQVTEGLNTESGFSEEQIQNRLLKRRIGDSYFQGALKMIHLAHLEISSEATQCLFFVSLYFAFLVRPLQGWEYLNASAARCLLFLAYPSAEDESEEPERIRRIFWSCYILESDYMAELSACPPSGIAHVESSVPLPGSYHTHIWEVEEEQSSLYFLACISMRRLLNRVHNLLYARDTGAALNTRKFRRIVGELKHQLDDWRKVLPPAFAFNLDSEPTATEYGGFLRQRYLTCQAVIYRPYLMWVLAVGDDIYGDAAQNHEALENCKICLDANLMHVLNLRSFSHTVLVDTWICSLSMAGGMLVLLSAFQIPALRSYIESRVTSVGSHLKALFAEWRRILIGSDCPSVQQSFYIISEADGHIRSLYEGECNN